MWIQPSRCLCSEREWLFFIVSFKDYPTSRLWFPSSLSRIAATLPIRQRLIFHIGMHHHFFLPLVALTGCRFLLGFITYFSSSAAQPFSCFKLSLYHFELKRSIALHACDVIDYLLLVQAFVVLIALACLKCLEIDLGWRLVRGVLLLLLLLLLCLTCLVH